MPSPNAFTVAKDEFDELHKHASQAACIVPVRGQPHDPISIRNSKNQPNEEYYKWQFITALIAGGLVAKDYIGVEVHFPKGNKGSTALKLDGAIFDDSNWAEVYCRFWSDRKSEDLEWLNEHLLAVIEFKKNDKEIEKVFTGQVKPAMREKDPSTSYVLGIYYDAERLFLFHRREGLYLRYDESKNAKGDQSKIGDLSLHLPDPYAYIPTFNELVNKVHKPSGFSRAGRSLEDLNLVTSIASLQIQSAFSDVLRALDKAGLVNQRGYHILIQALALKIFDEKRNKTHPQRKLDFYVESSESHFKTLADAEAQSLIARMQSIRTEAVEQYQKILRNQDIDWKNQGHVRSVVAICEAFQDYSFVRSAKTDLYQLVFYNFANSFKRDEAAQFLTPLPVIDFIVKLVNPRNGDSVIDPCCGIGDFLSLAFVHSREKADGWWLDDANIYGVDLDENMITLATLNMLLNGDGEAKLFDRPDKGSILSKVAAGTPPKLIDLLPGHHSKGNWDNWPDKTELLKFDVVLTNPPFGEDRAYRIKSKADRDTIELYETWHLARGLEAEAQNGADKQPGSAAKANKVPSGDTIDLGVVFLENAYRILKDGGRLGIVLSNSIASINKWAQVRKWLMDRMRIVGLFDLPSNVFAETGVNTTILVAYKPTAAELTKLNQDGYSIFVRDIKAVGYERRTSKRNVFFNPMYKMDNLSFEVEVDEDGAPVRDEEFTQAVADFRKWTLSQEDTLQKLFIRED